MAYFVRKINQIDNWQLECKCTPGNAPTDPFYDLRAKKCELSVFKIEDSNLNLNEVLTELALMKGNDIPDLYYLRLEEADLSSLEIRKSSAREPKCKNTDSYHYDIVCLNAQKLTNLLTIIWGSFNAKLEVRVKEEMKEIIKKTVEQGNLDEGNIPRPIKAILNS